jgi:hypothetical protein
MWDRQRPVLRYSRHSEVALIVLIASETTAKGTGLEKSAGKEDPEHNINGVNSGVHNMPLVELSLGCTECDEDDQRMIRLQSSRNIAGNTTWYEGGPAD